MENVEKETVDDAGVAGDAGVVGDVVELTYRPVAADFSSALRARMRMRRQWRLQRWLVVFGGFLLVLEAVLLALGQPGLPLFLLALSTAGLALDLLSPWLLGRRLQRLAERQGEWRVTVTETGISVATDTTTTSLTWQAQPRYRETPRVFALFSDDANATGFTLLPKHGLPASTDTDRLRALLNRHVTRC
ncbi:YcxB family protein [Streptomyces sp. NPDC005435]|uniref:YcxB family protein n=1 Tax=Streptomyces sp. NPDC005435 TaxID=3154464 RepID=UPI003455CE5D